MSDAEGGVTRREVARGAGLAGLARAGALIEALAQPLYVWLFGLPAYGLYVVLWGAVSIAENIVDLAMTSALQRVVPGEEEDAAHGAVKFAMLAALIPATITAIVAFWQAEAIAALISAAPADKARLPDMIRLFAWALPLWTFIEVASAAARARRAFGPEIRLRIFWEQIARIVFALIFFASGLQLMGLVSAHLASLALTAALSIPLLGRYYDLKRLLWAPMPAALQRNLLTTGFALLPATLSRRLLIDGPAVVLNLMLPGVKGAAAAGLFEIARKIATVPLVVRQAFQYVMAPLSAAQARVDRAEIAPLYRFASRVSTALVIPLAGLLIFAGKDIFSIYRPEVMAALPLLAILTAARAAEAIVGPATAVVEMTGHRLLPLVNALAGVALWAALAFLLVPRVGATGMAIATGAATVLIAGAATLELAIADGLQPFDRRLGGAFAIAAAGVVVMAIAAELLGGPLRFTALMLIWAATSWLTLRHGLSRSDREALGGIARRLKLVRGA